MKDKKEGSRKKLVQSPKTKTDNSDKTLLDWFEFETKIRKTVFDLVDPNVQDIA
jgi:hypothetical protein